MFEVKIQANPDLQLGEAQGVLAFYEFVALCEAGEYSVEFLVPAPFTAKAVSAWATEGTSHGPVVGPPLVNTLGVHLAHDGKLFRVRFSHHHKSESGKFAALNVGVQGMIFFERK
jgi:hypothetical protein